MAWDTVSLPLVVISPLTQSWKLCMYCILRSLLVLYIVYLDSDFDSIAIVFVRLIWRYEEMRNTEMR